MTPSPPTPESEEATVFLIPWAVSYEYLGAFGFIEILLFMIVLGVGLLYAWKRGALEWE